MYVVHLLYILGRKSSVFPSFYDEKVHVFGIRKHVFVHFCTEMYHFPPIFAQKMQSLSLLFAKKQECLRGSAGNNHSKITSFVHFATYLQEIVAIFVPKKYNMYG